MFYLVQQTCVVNFLVFPVCHKLQCLADAFVQLWVYDVYSGVHILTGLSCNCLELGKNKNKIKKRTFEMLH